MDADVMLGLIDSPDFRDRVTGVKMLSQHTDQEEVFARLVACLADANTAVGQAAAVALVLGAGEKGLTAVLAGVDNGDEQIAFWLINGLENLWLEGSDVVLNTRRLAADSDDESVRRGAERVTAYLQHPFPVQWDRGPWYAIGDDDVGTVT